MQKVNDGFPINVELVQKMAYLPVKLAELAETNPTGALELLTAWGKGTKPITILWDEALTLIDGPAQTGSLKGGENQNERPGKKAAGSTAAGRKRNTANLRSSG